MRGLLVCLVLFAIIFVGRQSVFGQNEPLVVAIRPIEPFVIPTNAGYGGFSIELWEAIASDLEVEFTYLEVGTVQDMLEAVETGAADVAIGNISITAEREERIDFSHSMFNSGLQILTLSRSGDSIINTFRSIFSPLMLRVLGVGLIILLIVAHIIWLIERHENSDFHQDYLHGIAEALYWSVVTLTTVGYGDKVTKKPLGRLITILWMLASVVLISYFTAAATTSLTVNALNSRISDPSDLGNKRIGTLAGTTSADYLTTRGLSFYPYDDIPSAITALSDGIIEAVVYDAPVLEYHATRSGNRRLQLVEPIFQTEDYGIVVANGSSLRDPINQALLLLRESGRFIDLQLP